MRLPLLAVAMMALHAACGTDRPEDLPSVRLVDDLASKASSDSIRASKVPESGAWETGLVEYYWVDGLEREVENYRAKIVGYESLGSSGSLFLTFYNDLLAQTVFCPDDLASYVKKVETDLGVRLADHPAGFRERGAEISLVTVRPARRCIVWRDDRLMRLFEGSD